MKIKTDVNKKTSATQKADTISFIREAIKDSRSEVKDVVREIAQGENISSESVQIPQRANRDYTSIHYGKV